MISILFVCLGNICRSPMAEGVFNHILEREGETQNFTVDSAGLLDYHRGELPDSRMRSHAHRRGYTLTHRSRPVTRVDFDKFDYLIGMDNQNIQGLNQLAKTDEHRAKILRMTDFCTLHNTSSVPDPYYGGTQGFEDVINLLEDAAEGLFRKLKENPSGL